MRKKIKIFGGVLLALFILGPSAVSKSSLIYKIKIDDYIIHPITAEYIEGAIARAEKDQAAALLIVLDTPGGLLESTRDIVKAMMNANVPIIVYVSPAGARAASAGVFITLAAHIAAMAPTTHIGAAHPVQLGEPTSKDLLKKETDKEKTAPPVKAPMEDKIMQDTLAWVENIATARHRNVKWAREAVEKSISSTAEEAKKLGVIDLIAADEKELLAKIDGEAIKLPNQEIKVLLHAKEADVLEIKLNWRQSILNILINPNIAYILLTLGFYGLLFEITHPGSWAPGVAGLIALMLAFYSFHIIPTDYAGTILTIVGLLLLGAEIFITSFGLLALGGLVCLFFGALFLVDQPADFLKLSLGVAIPTIAAALAIFGMLATLVLKSHRRKVVTGAEGLLGALAIAETDLNPIGTISLQGEIWEAQSEEPIRKGERVEILRLENLKLYVRRSLPQK